MRRLADALRVVMVVVCVTLTGVAGAQVPRHWAEGRWETRDDRELGALVITRGPDGGLQVTEAVHADEWNDSRALNRADIEVDGDRIKITNDLGNVYKLERVGADQLAGTFFKLRYQTHMIKTRPVVYFRAD